MKSESVVSLHAQAPDALSTSWTPRPRVLERIITLAFDVFNRLTAPGLTLFSRLAAAPISQTSSTPDTCVSCQEEEEVVDVLWRVANSVLLVRPAGLEPATF